MSLFDIYYSSWNVLNFVSKTTRDTLQDFISECKVGKEYSKTYWNLNNDIRKELHNICDILGIEHISEGSWNKRSLKLTVYSNTIFSRPENLSHSDFNKRKKQKERERRKEIKREQEIKESELQYSKMLEESYCDCCERNGKNSVLGIWRLSRIICMDCVNSDDYLGAFKWESFESIYL